MFGSYNKNGQFLGWRRDVMAIDRYQVHANFIFKTHCICLSYFDPVIVIIHSINEIMIWVTWNSSFVLANTSVRSPWKFYISIVNHGIYRTRVSYNPNINFIFKTKSAILTALQASRTQPSLIVHWNVHKPLILISHLNCMFLGWFYPIDPSLYKLKHSGQPIQCISYKKSTDERVKQWIQFSGSIGSVTQETMYSYKLKSIGRIKVPRNKGVG